MTSVRLDIEVPRNGHYFQTWQLRDADGQPIDITGHVLEMDCRAIAGAGGVIASASFDIYDPVNGVFNVTWDGADFATVAGVTEIVRLAYDFKHIFPDGIVEIPTRGHIVLMPEVTA